MTYRIPDIERFAVIFEIVEIERVVISLVAAMSQLAQGFNPAIHQNRSVDAETLDDNAHFRIIELLLDHI